MGSTPTPSFTEFAKALQRGNRSFISVGAKQAIRHLSKDPLARQALYGRAVTPRQMIRIGKELQKASPTVFKTYQTARTVLTRLTKTAMEKAAHAPAGNAKGVEEERKEEKQHAAFVRTKQIEAEGKKASIQQRTVAERRHDIVEERTQEQEQAPEAVAQDPFGDT